jgi:hypothetical protein
MTTEHEPTRYLSADELRVLKFAVRRQITRWANKRNPNADQQSQRATLQRVLHALDDDAFAAGCNLHVPREQ